jgi:hypothetical protein
VHVLATLLLTLCLPGPQAAPPLRPPTDQRLTTQTHPSGQWYLAETGHAVYCYGPVLLVKQPTGDLQRVATFCKGDQTMVPLKD